MSVHQNTPPPDQKNTAHDTRPEHDSHQKTRTPPDSLQDRQTAYSVTARPEPTPDQKTSCTTSQHLRTPDQKTRHHSTRQHVTSPDRTQDSQSRFNTTPDQNTTPPPERPTEPHRASQSHTTRHQNTRPEHHKT